MKKNTFKKSNSYLIGGILLIAFLAFSCKKDEDSSDITNPYVISYNPVLGVGGISTSSNLYLTFDGIVLKGTGNITITTDVEKGKQVIAVTDDAVLLINESRIMVINPPADLLPGRVYSVTLDAGIVVDMAGNKYFGMPDGEKWTFTTGGNAGDLTPPTLSSVSPANGATSARIFTLSMTFNESIKVNKGNIVVYDSSDAVLETIDATNTSCITVNQTDVTLTLPTPLGFGKEYYIKMDAGVIQDMGGNDFAGITTKTTWKFKTIAGSGSDLIVRLPFDADFADASGNGFDATLGATATANPEIVTDATRGKVIHFTAGSYLQLPKHDLLRINATDNFSVNLWVKMPPISSDPVLFGCKDWNSGKNPGFCLFLDGADVYPTSGSGWGINAGNYPKGNRIDFKASECTPKAPALADDKWHMVTIIINRTAQTLNVYIDGTELVNSKTSAYDLTTLPTDLWDHDKDYAFNIWEDGTGKYNSTDDARKKMSGYMDELSCYNKTLSANEIKALFTK